MKKIIITMLSTIILVSLAGCAGSRSDITVISREEGSGTRGAFIELLGVEQKNENGDKADNTTIDAIIANKTDVMLTQVKGNEYSIGYVSAGSLNNEVKAIKVDGVAPTSENIESGKYKLSRPFHIAVKKNVSETAQDFIDFMLSKEGQKVVSESYIAVSQGEPFAGTKPSGKIVVAGSSSVTPIMEKLKEAYIKTNPNADIEIQQSDSTSGMQAVIEGICDIGMASRDLKESELTSLTPIRIAIDGIAVIVNPANPVEDITSEQARQIFTGEVTSWDEIG